MKPTLATPLDITGDVRWATVREVDTDAVIAELTTAYGGITANAGEVPGRLAKAIRDRIDRELAGEPIRLKIVHPGDAGKALFRQHLLAHLLPELYADPLPDSVLPARQIFSPKAVSLLDGRLNEAFNPPAGVLELPGVRLTSADLFELIVLIQDELMADAGR